MLCLCCCVICYGVLNVVILLARYDNVACELNVLCDNDNVPRCQ